MIIQLEPLDTLFFRDGKPFEMGDDTWASGIFPPPPSVFYGALRSAYFAENIDKLILANTPNDPTNLLEINAIYIGNEKLVFFPIPLEIVKIKGEKEEEAFVEYNEIKSKFYSSSYVKHIHKYNIEVQNPEGLLELTELNKYIEQKEDKITYWNVQKYVNTENKIGITRNNLTHASEDARLYRLSMNRLFAMKGDKPLSFLIDSNIDKLGFMPKMLKLGGEGKSVKCSEYREPIHIKTPTIGKQFKLCFLTPCIFENSKDKLDGGWLPKNFEYDTLSNSYIGKWKGVKLKLIRAFVGKTNLIGGFDIKKKQPKKMYRTVPAGSVYHFEIADGTDTNKIIDIFHKKTVCDIYQKQGFGLTVIAQLSNTNI